jgi:hypothetical protein
LNVADIVLQSYEPEDGNFGGTSLINNPGSKTAVTQRFDAILPELEEVFFMKIDAEKSEEMIFDGMGRLFTSCNIKNFVMEVRSWAITSSQETVARPARAVLL